MTVKDIVRPAPGRPQRIAFTVVAVVVAALLSTALRGLPAPWTEVNPDHSADPATHRWHHALEAAVDGLGVVAIVALVLKPLSRSLLAQYVGVGAVIGGAIILPFAGPTFLFVVIPLFLIPLSYPHRSALLRTRSAQGVSVPLLAVSVGAAAVLIPRAIQELRWQVTGYLGEQAVSTAWATDVEHLVLLAIAGLAASTRLPGWRILAIGCATVYAYLGVVAVMLPGQPGSWGIAGGAASWAAGVLFGAATVMDRSSHTVGEAEPMTV